MEPGGEGESLCVFCVQGSRSVATKGAAQSEACGAASGAAGVYLLLALSVLASTCGVLVQQV